MEEENESTTEESKEVTAKLEGKAKESRPAVAKDTKKKEKKSVVELEREYVVPLRKKVLVVPRYKRAKKAVRILKEFIVKHMGIRDRDLKKVKIDINLNNELWFRGIKKPANKIKVKAKKIDGIVYVELAEIPEVVKFAITRKEKREALAKDTKTKTPKKSEKMLEEDKDRDGVEDKKEEAEDRKAASEKAVKDTQTKIKETKHSTKAFHEKKTMPVRKSLKK